MAKAKPILSYELAKKLKKAGWLQPEEFSGECYVFSPGERKWPGPKEVKEIVYSPSLSELVEACGEDAQAMLEAYAKRWITLQKREGR